MSQFLHVLLKVGSFKITTLLFQSKQVQNRFNLVQDYVFFMEIEPQITHFSIDFHKIWYIGET